MVRLSASHPVNVERVPVSREIAPHDHDYYEISLVRQGRAQHRTPGGTQQLMAGSVVVVPPGGVHAFSQAQGMEVTNLYYLAEWIASGWREQWSERGLVPLFLAEVLFRRSGTPQPVVLQLTPREAAAIGGELDEIAEELARIQPSALLLKSALLKVLVRLSRASDQGESEFPEMVWTVLQDIEQCLENGRPFDLHALLRRWPFTPDHGSRKFRRVTGLAPQEYYQRRRIQRACALLLDPTQTATGIAMELGFADAAHFSRHFRRHMGISPRDYRRKYAVAGIRPDLSI